MSSNNSKWLQFSVYDDDATGSSAVLASTPSKPLVRQACASTAETAAELAHSHSQYKEDEFSFQKQEEKIQTTEAKLLLPTAAITPSNHMPAELLSAIFMIHVWENRESPWILVHVSRAWRAVAFTTKNLWASICLTSPNWAEERPKCRNASGKEYCVKKEQLDRALQRARGALIDLRIYNRCDRLYGRPLKGGDMELAGSNHQPEKARVSALDVWDEWTWDCWPLDRFTFRDLVSLHMTHDFPEVIDKVVAEAQNLRQLHISELCILKLGTCAGWRTLEDIIIYGRFKDLTIVLPALPYATRLKTLWLSGDGFMLEWPSFPELWPIDCPNLTHLKLKVTGIERAEPHSIHLPHLVELDIETCCCKGILSAFNVPSLYKLQARVRCFDKHSDDLFLGAWPLSTSTGSSPVVGNMEPRVLELGQFDLSQGLLASTLMERPLLEEITILYVEITHTFFDAFLPTIWCKDEAGQAGEHGSRLSCPRLKRVLIKQPYPPLDPQEQVRLEESVRQWLRGRVKAGVPIERLAIRYGLSKEGWKEFVKGV